MADLARSMAGEIDRTTPASLRRVWVDVASERWWHPAVATVVVWFHPGCEVTERAAELLEVSGAEVERLPVLERPPSADAIRTACRLAGLSPRELVRKREPRYAELRAELEAASDEALLELLANNPALLQRPIVIMGPRAVLARPAELALTLLAPKPPPALPAGSPRGLDPRPR